MKKFILVISVLILFVTYSKEQCNIYGLFPVKAGMSKFDVINVLNLKSNILDIDIEDNNTYLKPVYLNGDSVKVFVIKFKYSKHHCISSVNNSVTLVFADNKLFEMQLDISYYPSELYRCNKNYTQMFRNLKKTFVKYDTTIINDVETKDKVGERHTLYKTKEDILKDKYEVASVSYKLDYDAKFDSETQKDLRTGKIEKYSIKLTYVNLNVTKFTRNYYPIY